MFMKSVIKNITDGYLAVQQEYFKYLHAHPELSFKEYKTSAYIRAKLQEMHIEVLDGFSGTSVVGLLQGASDGPVIAFRADIDALPIQENTGLSYQSVHDGVMHACGHDAHTATLLTLAKVLFEHRELVKGRVKFIFQSAEEKLPGGGKTLCEEGVMQDVDAVFAYHCSSMVPLGTIATTVGATSASVAKYDVVIHGKGGHICNPDQAMNPVPVACTMATTINQLLSEKASPLEKAVVTVSYIHGGQRENIIASEATLGGSIRTFNNDLTAHLFQKLRDVCNGVCMAYGCTCDVTTTIGYPAAINTKKETEYINQAIDALGYERWTTEPAMNGEDFSYYLMEKPGSMCYVGMAIENPQPHHNGNFQLNLDGLQVALELELAIYLKATEQY
jgi:amidohydrolase